jgi:hypothetical protein
MRAMRSVMLFPAGAALVLAYAAPAHAFPPYRSTDAGTAGPYELELRLGLGRLQRESSETEVLTPLLRTNLGLPGGFELISELEYSPRDDSFADGALGAKWAGPVSEQLSIGIETLALMPVSESTGGVGVESQLLTTFRADSYRLHLNAGGFHDPREAVSESGWRASALLEFPRDTWRIGLELFGADTNRSEADVRAGAGLIYDLGGFDIRTGVHVGLTSEAPDFVMSLWLSTSFPLRQ